MVDSLIARVGAMARGNAISLPVCGREVKFTLEVLRETLLRALHAYGQAMSAIRNYLPKMPWMISFLHFTDWSADSSFRPPGFRCH